MINIEFGKRITESNYHNGYDTYNQPICTLSFLDEIDLIRFKEEAQGMAAEELLPIVAWNDNIPEVVELMKCNPRKVWATHYFDDRFRPHDGTDFNEIRNYFRIHWDEREDAINARKIV
jgi:hypothetical protein